MKKYIFQYHAFQEETPEGLLKDLTTLDVYADSEKQAEKIVRSLIKKKEYSLYSIIEKPSKIGPYVFLIQGFDQRNEITGNLFNCVTIELHDQNTENATRRSAQLVKRKFYRIKSIIERLPNEV